MTRQQRYQAQRRAEGKCRQCGKVAEPAHWGIPSRCAACRQRVVDDNARRALKMAQAAVPVLQAEIRSEYEIAAAFMRNELTPVTTETVAREVNERTRQLAGAGARRIARVGWHERPKSRS